LPACGLLPSPDGYILTAAHVVEDASSIEVQLLGEKMTASVVAAESEGDVALLRVYPREQGKGSAAQKSEERSPYALTVVLHFARFSQPGRPQRAVFWPMSPVMAQSFWTAS